jgi:hypothetical protein
MPNSFVVLSSRAVIFTEFRSQTGLVFRGAHLANDRLAAVDTDSDGKGFLQRTAKHVGRVQGTHDRPGWQIDWRSPELR